jgi:membrane-bound lytic murein transglycosylase A
MTKKIFIGLTSLLAMLAFACYHGLFGPHLFLTKTTFPHLSQWEQDDHRTAFQAFRLSCAEILTRKPFVAFSALPHSKTNRDWQTICLAANKLQRPTAIQARQFFEFWFEPYAVKNNFNPHGLFTGYYLPVLQGSLKKNKRCPFPIHGIPRDWVKINLGLFKPSFAGKTLIGQLNNNTVVPYPNRAAIQQGCIGKNANILAWTDNAVDLFFAQIQGSAIVQLPQHPPLLIGYASTNGQPYAAIGKILIENHTIAKKNMSMQAIRSWLVQHPAQINDFLNYNASYVFFRVLNTSAPVGSEQVPLTAQGSLAVDTQYIPLGAPVWLSTQVPAALAKPAVTYHKLLIAQDTGGAIKGIVRGDIYWGSGSAATFSAGHMQQTGRYWLLLPQ